MSINSQIIATMESEGIINDENLPDPSLMGAPQVALNAGDISQPGHVATQNSETPLTDSVKQQLLNPATTFKSLENQVELVTNMEALNAEIAKKPAISFADAEQVAMTFEGFSKAVPMRGFTKLPSQVFFKETKNFMVETIKLRKENLLTEAEAYFDGHIADAEEAFEDFKGFYGARLLESLECFRNKTVGFLQQKDGISQQIFQAGNDFINVATVPVKDIPELILPGNKDLFEDAVENLQGMLEHNVHVKNLLLTIQKKGSFADFTDPINTAASQSFDPSLKDFLCMFADPYLKGFVEAMEKDAEDGLKELREIQAEKNFNPTDFTAMRNFVVENGEDIDESNAKVHYYIEMIELVQKLHLNVSVVLDYFTTER